MQRASNFCFKFLLGLGRGAFFYFKSFLDGVFIYFKLHYSIQCLMCVFIFFFIILKHLCIEIMFKIYILHWCIHSNVSVTSRSLRGKSCLIIYFRGRTHQETWSFKNKQKLNGRSLVLLICSHCLHDIIVVAVVVFILLSCMAFFFLNLPILIMVEI